MNGTYAVTGYWRMTDDSERQSIERNYTDANTHHDETSVDLLPLFSPTELTKKANALPSHFGLA